MAIAFTKATAVETWGFEKVGSIFCRLIHAATKMAGDRSWFLLRSAPGKPLQAVLLFRFGLIKILIVKKKLHR